MENMVPYEEIQTRVKNLQKILVEKERNGALLLLNSDIFYFAGTVQSSFLFIPAEGEPVLMIRRGLMRAQQECGFKQIVAVKSPKDIPAVLAQYGCKTEKLGMELDVLPVMLYKTYQKMFGEAEITDISSAIKEIRSVKSAYEIDILRSAMQAMAQAFETVPSLLKENMAEIELAALFEAELRKRGYSGPAKMRSFNQELFYGNVCAGPSGACTGFFDGPVGGSGVSVSNPQGAGWRKIQRNEPVYIDYTCVIQGYNGDQTRMFCIGEMPEKFAKGLKDMLLLQKELLQMMKPGVPAEDVYTYALALAEKMGYKDHFMGYKENQVRFVGHGIGIELDEWPVFAKGMKQQLVPGMTFALEPKLVFADGAVGIENSFVMTEQGPEYLYYSPEETICLK